MKKGVSDTILYDEIKVVERFGFSPKLLVDYKGLRGDPSDNIAGVRGIGEKTATALIQEFGTIENIYKNLNKVKLSGRIKDLLKENEEGALFSKTLATIRTDAPIHFVLPPEWKKNLELNKLLSLFNQLEFRTMGERAKKLLERPDVAQKTNLEAQPPSKKEVGPLNSEVKKLCLAFWVVDSNLTNPTLEDVFRFCKTSDIEEAKKIIESELDKRKVRKVFEEIEKPIIKVVEEMNERGIRVDERVLKTLSLKYHKEIMRLEQEIWKEAEEEFNINSPKILSHILFGKLQLADKRQKKTPTGALSTKESELEKLRDKHPIITLVLEYRELAKLLSTYIDAIPPLLDKNSRLHSTFLQAGTTTGRMSSNNPNLQNIPNKTLLGRAIRHAFVAEAGFKLLSLDYSQIELRIAAILSQDKKLIEIFKSGVDVHTGVATRVFKVPQELVDKSMRTKAKTINFGILYGMGVNALRANLGVDRKEAQEFYDKYFETFVDLAAYLDKIKTEARRRSYTETLFGRRRYFAGLRSPLSYVRAQTERMVINAPIQGTSADLTKIAMKKIDEHIKSEKHKNEMRLVLQVHDELVYEVKENTITVIAPEIKRIMENVVDSKKTSGVVCVANVGVGDNWAEMKEI